MVHDRPEFHTNEALAIVDKIYKDFVFEYPHATKVPISWAHEIYAMLQNLQMMCPDILFQQINEQRGVLVFKYATSRTPRSYVDHLVNQTKQNLVAKGVHRDEKTIKKCPHCGKEI